MATYIYNGNTIDEERVNSAAQNLGLTVEDYLKEYNFEIKEDEPAIDESLGKESGPVMETATAGPKVQSSTELLSEDISLDSDPTDPIKKKKPSQRYAWITPGSSKPLYEKEYLKKFANQTIDGIKYPTSFDDYVNSKGKKVLSHNGTNKQQEAAENAATVYEDLGNTVWANENEDDQLETLQSTINSVVDSPDQFTPVFNTEEIETNTRAIDMQLARQLRKQELTVNAVNDALGFYKTDMPTLTGIVVNKGVDFLDTNQKKLFDLQKEQKRSFDDERKKELQIQIDELRTAPPLFHDANTGDLVAYEQISYGQKATDKAVFTEKDVLQEELTKDYYSLVGLAQEIIESPFKIGGKASTSIQAVAMLGETLLGGDQTLTEKLKDLEQIAAGNIPSDITYLPFDDPLSLAFNNSLDQWLITNAALQLNEDYTQTMPESRPGTFISSMSDFFGVDAISSPTYSGIEKAEVLYGNMREAGLKISKKYEQTVNEAQKRNTLEYAGEWAPLAGMILEARVTGNLLKGFYSFTKGFNAVKKANKFAAATYSGIKSTRLRNAFKTTHKVFASAAKEAAIFGAGGALFGGIFRPESQIDTASDIRFGLTMGGTSAISKIITDRISTSALFGKFSPVLQGVYSNFMRSKTIRNEIGRARGAALGGINLQIVDAALNNEEFVNSIRGVDGEIDYGLLYSRTAGEIMKLYFLGKATPFWRSGFLFDWRADILASKGKTAEGQKARRKFAITNEESPEAVENKLREVEKEANQLIAQGLVKDGAKLIRDTNYIRHEELLKEAKRILEGEKIDGGQSSLSVTPTEILEVVNAIRMRGILNMRESAILAKIPPGIIAERLGVDPNSKQYRGLESLQQWHLHINEALDGKHGFYGATFTLPAEALKARQHGYDFFLKQAGISLELDGLLAKPSSTDEDKDRIKQLKEEQKQYEPGGEKYNEFVNIADAEAASAIAKDAQKLRESGVQEIIETKTEKQFQSEYDRLHNQKPGDEGYVDVTKQVAFIFENRKVINNAYAKTVRNFNPATHEVTHELGIIDDLRNPNDNYNMTEKGIRIIDEIINALTPRQRNLLDLRLERSGVHLNKDGTPRPKKFWYEEHLNHLSELMAQDQIQYTPSLGNQLLNFMPSINKIFGIKIDNTTGRDIFNMLSNVGKGQLTPEKDLANLKGRKSLDSQEILDILKRYNDGEITEEEYIELSNKLLFEEETTEFQIDKAETVIEQKAETMVEQKPKKIIELKPTKFTGVNPKQLIKIYRNPESTVDDVKAAYDELAIQYGKLAISAFLSEQSRRGGFGIDPRTNEDLYNDFFLEFEKKEGGVLNNYDGIQEFSTYVNATIRPKYPTYVEKYKTKKDISSIDDESQSRQITQLEDRNDRTETASDPSDYDRPSSLIKAGELGLNATSRDVLTEKTRELVNEGAEPGTYIFADFPVTPGAEALGNQTGIDPIKFIDLTKTLNYGYSYRVAYTDRGKKVEKTIRKSTWEKTAAKYPDAKIIEFIEPETYRVRRFLKLAFKNGFGKLMPPYTALPFASKEAKDPSSPAYRPGLEKAETRGGLVRSRVVIQEFYTDAKNAPQSLFGQRDPQYTVSEQRWSESRRQEGPAGTILLKYAGYSFAEISKILDQGLEENRPERMSDKDWDKLQKRNAQLLQGLANQYAKSATMSEYTAQTEGNPYELTSYNWGRNWSQFSSEQVQGQTKRLFFNEAGRVLGKKQLKNISGKIRSNEKLQKAYDETFDAMIKGEEAFNAQIKKVEKQYGLEVSNLLYDFFNNQPWIHAVYAHRRLTDKRNGLGYEFEEFIRNALSASGIENANVKLEGGNNSKAVDIIWEIDGKTYNLELKLDTNAPLTSFTVSRLSANYQKIKNLPQIQKFVKSLNTKKFTKGYYKGSTFNEALSKMYNDAIAFAKAAGYRYREIKDEEGNLISIKGDVQIFEYLKNDGKNNRRQASLEVTENMPIDLAIELFRGLTKEEITGTNLEGQKMTPNKDYVTFGDYGTYALDADNNPLGAPVLAEQFSGVENPIRIRQRLVRNGNELKDGSKEYYYSIRVQPFLNVKPQNKGLNLLDASDIANAVNNARSFEAFSSENITIKANEYIYASNPKFAVDAKINRSQAIIQGNEVDAKNKTAYLFGKISPENNDFLGLLYDTLPSGAAGEAQKQFYKEAFTDPYNRAYNRLDNDKLKFTQNYRTAKKEYNISDVRLAEKVEDTYFRAEDAVRVYIWEKQGHTIPEITDKEKGMLFNYLKENNLIEFAEYLNKSNGSFGWGAPQSNWITGGLKGDIAKTLKGVNRPIRLEKWQENVDAFFTEENLNKMQAAYGTRWRVSMQNSLIRQKTGENRYYSMDSQVGQFADQLSGAVLNTLNWNNKSAILQLTSASNFINWTDNNPLQAAKAFANQKQYWSDVVMLMYTDFLKERRGGLTMELNEADIADLAKKGGFRGLTAKLLKVGMAPTVIADNIAIAGGGATFYRNRANRYMREGMEKEAAEQKALEDWRNTAETTQQSSRPDKISMNQAGPLGRVVLAYTNTPQQYMREMQKSLRDIKNGRGDYKTNVSKVLYYGFMQNLIFTGLQQGVNAVFFDEADLEIPTVSSDEEFRAYVQTLPPLERKAEIDKRKQKLKEIKELEIEQKKKINAELNTINSMLDTSLKGLGLYGQVLSTVKNAGFRAYIESNKDNPNYKGAVPTALLGISPGLSVKYSQISRGIGTFQYNAEEIRERGLGDFNNPAYMGTADIIAGVTNIPLNRMLTKIKNMQNALNEDLATTTRIASAAGWSEYALGIPREEWVGTSLETQIEYELWNKEQLQKLDPVTRGLWLKWRKESLKKQKEKNK